MAGIIGWVFDDPAVRAAAVETIAGLVPGLEPIVASGLESLVAERGALSLIGLIGAAFGASIFYDALDDSMNRVLPGGGQRNPILRRLLGVGAVILLAIAGVVALGIGIAVGPDGRCPPGLRAGRSSPCSGRWPSIGLLALAIGAIYRWVPIERPALADIQLPALMTAVAIWLASELFGLLAPLLVRQLAVFGVFVSLLAPAHLAELGDAAAAAGRLMGRRAPGRARSSSALARTAATTEASRRRERQTAADAGLDAGARPTDDAEARLFPDGLRRGHREGRRRHASARPAVRAGRRRRLGRRSLGRGLIDGRSRRPGRWP